MVFEGRRSKGLCVPVCNIKECCLRPYTRPSSYLLIIIKSRWTISVFNDHLVLKVVGGFLQLVAKIPFHAIMRTQGLGNQKDSNACISPLRSRGFHNQRSQPGRIRSSMRHRHEVMLNPCLALLLSLLSNEFLKSTVIFRYRFHPIPRTSDPGVQAAARGRVSAAEVRTADLHLITVCRRLDAKPSATSEPW